jgi:hypothetical protein
MVEISTSADTHFSINSGLSRPSTSPAPTNRLAKSQTTMVIDEEKPQRKNPFDEFMSSSDVDEITRRRMMLEDRAQMLARETFRQQSAFLKDDLRARTPDELYENKVLFSRGGVALHEGDAIWGGKDRTTALKTGSAEQLMDAHKCSQKLRISHRKVTESVRELGFLNLVADQALTRPKKGKKGTPGSPSDSDRSADNLLGNLRPEERKEISMSLFQGEIDLVMNFFTKFSTNGSLDKGALRKALQKNRGEYREGLFEELWRTMLPPGAKNVTFMVFVRWAAKFLPMGTYVEQKEAPKKQPSAAEVAAAQSKANLREMVGMDSALVRH